MLIQADARLLPLADQSVHCVVTSPPYFSLRDYGTGTWVGGDDPACEHKRVGQGPNSQRPGRSYIQQNVELQQCRMCGATRNDAQIGLEAQPTDYIANMLIVMREVWRVLRDDGTCWLNIGDSYAGGGGSAPMPKAAHGLVPHRAPTPAGLVGKQLLLIPYRLAIALQDEGWIVRSHIVWHKPNAMPESVRDRPTSAHESIWFLTKKPDYWYDQDAIREPYAREWGANNGGSWAKLDAPAGTKAGHHSGDYPMPDKGGRNKRDVWSVPTKPYGGEHFAAFPPELIKPAILAGAAPKACGVCRAPWRRVVERTRNGRDWNPTKREGGDVMESGRSKSETMPDDWTPPRTLGWESTCDHDDDSGRAIVLDPFGGTGTTAMVCRELGRDFVHCDLNRSYIADHARSRLAGQTPALPGFAV